MQPTEAEIEREKLAKIKSVASQGAAIARRFGHSPELVKEFLGHYFRHVDADDIGIRAESDLLGLVVNHFQLAQDRPLGRAAVAVLTPTPQHDRWSVGGATVVQIVTDDQPFLVDSVTMEVLRQGWSIREVFHPQFQVRRDVAGHLQTVVRTSEAARDTQVVGESWMHLEVTPPADRDNDTDRALEDGLREVLRSLAEAVDDWDKMRDRARRAAEDLRAAHPGRPEEVRTAEELLDWLIADNFTFLGYREYDVSRQAAEPGEPEHFAYAMQPRPGTGLGILRGDQAAEQAFAALPPADAAGAPLMVITKDNVKATVHRPSYLDYIGLRSFDDHGRVVAERRFLGLFASTAYTDSVTRIPVLAQRAHGILHRSGYDPSSHGAKAILDVLNSYPRDELFQAHVTELAPVVERISRLKERRQVKVFARRDPYGRFLSCLVYFPRDRYTTVVRQRMERMLLEQLKGDSVDYTTRVSESVLARLHFVVRMAPGQRLDEIDAEELAERLTLATRSWDDDLADLVAGMDDADRLLRVSRGLPQGYKEDFTPKQGVKDLQALENLADERDMAMAMYRPDNDEDQADLRLKIFRLGTAMRLSQVLPHLTVLGVDVVDEHPYALPLGADRVGHVYEFGFTVPGGSAAVEQQWQLDARRLFMDAFAASYRGLSESDPYNALVMGADLDWRTVSLLRAIGHYLRQGGGSYSQTYIAGALAANLEISRRLVAMFAAKFDPDAEFSCHSGDLVTARQDRVNAFVAEIRGLLEEVASLDHDRIIRSYLAVINACIRTNFYQSDRPAIAFKLLPRKMPDLPEPRPAFEIYVYAPQVEGVHLRFGAVARGGLRWSDRSEDFRTEVLGLVKAQMVKNSVIIPVGAKGGFYAKDLPDPGDRDAWQAAGRACYTTFVGSLLDVTDNIVGGAVVPPDRVIRYDEDDVYLVVAADKGTATFSDLANTVAVERGYWLGDAFASGGSAGYDHKAMGITARGAWESVRRHLAELGRDTQTEDFTVVGIGDMSGDVFGNAMLLSRHIRLVAAFDHRHVFIDPSPDPAVAWQERQRLFERDRSSWADYDKSLISAGGGVFSRQLKAIKITDEMREVLGIEAGISQLSPAQMISAVLAAPVDLLFNGGVGTYVKASRENNSEVGDKANDSVRVNGSQLRARSVGEGGNLGLTQLGRVEYALAGGKINTDFIDNSAGVDTSDHEVNIKILLTGEVADGRLSGAERDELLASMTDEIATLVLANNDQQNLALANSEYQAGSMAGVHEDWMQRLADQRLLDRELEFLPTTAELSARRQQGGGLTTPELSVLLAYTKIVLEAELLQTELPDDPALHHLLIDYFPEELRERYADRMAEHQLHRQIIATAAVNDFVNQSGITCFHRLSGETGASADDLVRAQLACRSLFGAAALEARILRLGRRVDAATRTRLRLEVRTLVERATRWVVVNRRTPIDIGALTGELGESVRTVLGELPELLSGRDLAAYEQRRSQFEAIGVDTELAADIAILRHADAALTLAQNAFAADRDLVRMAEVHFTAGQRLGLDRLLGKIGELPRADRWQTMARTALRDDLHRVHAELTAEMLSMGDAGTPAEVLIDRWLESIGPVAERAVATIAEICDSPADLARMSVGLRTVRTLLGQS